MMNIRDDSIKKAKRKLKPLRINLDVAKPEERLIEGITEHWSEHRRKATNIRKAILLFADLQNGGVDRLVAEFPHIADALCGGKAVQSVTPAPVERERVPLETTRAKSSAAEVAGNFLSSLGGLFD